MNKMARLIEVFYAKIRHSFSGNGWTSHTLWSALSLKHFSALIAKKCILHCYLIPHTYESSLPYSPAVSIPIVWMPTSK